MHPSVSGLPSRTKVLVIIEALEVGGTERGIVRNLPRIDRSRFEVQVALLSHRGVLADRLEAAGIVLRCPQPPAPSPPPTAGLARTLRRLGRAASRVLWLRRVIADWRPDIVHVFLPESYVYTTAAHLLAPGKRRFIMSRASLNYYFKDFPELRLVEPFCHRLVHRAVGNSKAVLDNLRQEGLPDHKLFLLYNGIETTQFARTAEAVDVAEDRSVTMTAVANLFTYKGYEDLLAALAMLKPRQPRPWKLARYRAFCDEHGLSDHVAFLGPCDDVAALLRNSQLHIHASHTESLPNSVIEAMSAGLPVIGTTVGGIPELIVDGETGFLVPPADPAALCAAIERLMNDAELRTRLGQQAQQRARDLFDVESSSRRYEQLYSAFGDQRPEP